MADPTTTDPAAIGAAIGICIATAVAVTTAVLGVLRRSPAALPERDTQLPPPPPAAIVSPYREAPQVTAAPMLLPAPAPAPAPGAPREPLPSADIEIGKTQQRLATIEQRQDRSEERERERDEEAAEFRGRIDAGLDAIKDRLQIRAAEKGRANVRSTGK